MRLYYRHVNFVGRRMQMGREPTAERRIEILETAVNLFLSQGYLRTSMQDVAEAAKVSKATLYQLFESKEGLGTEAASLLTMRMLDRVEAAAEQEHPFSQELLKQSIQIRMEQFAQRSRLAEEILFSMEEGQKEQYLLPLVQNSLRIARCFTRVIMRTFGLGSELMAGELTFVLNGLLKEYMAVNGEEGLKLEEDAVCDLIIDCLEAVMERRRDKERMITPQQMRTFQETLDGEVSSLYPNLRKMQLRKALKGAIRDYEQSGDLSCLREASALIDKLKQMEEK